MCRSRRNSPADQNKGIHRSNIYLSYEVYRTSDFINTTASDSAQRSINPNVAWNQTINADHVCVEKAIVTDFVITDQSASIITVPCNVE